MYRATLEVLEVFRNGRQWTVAELALRFGEGKARSALRTLAALGYVACSDRKRTSKYACAKVWARTSAEFPPAPLRVPHGAQALFDAFMHRQK